MENLFFFQKMDMDIIIKITDKLEGKNQHAHDYGLGSLLQSDIYYCKQKLMRLDKKI